MFALAGSAALSPSASPWSLLFARQPEPDLEFEEELAEDNQSTGSQPGKPPKKKGTSPLLWVLLLVLLGIGGYFVMDPDGAMQTVDSLLGGGSEAPVVATAPAPRPVPPQPAPDAPPAAAAPAPGASPAPAAPAASAPAAPMAQAPAPVPSAPAPMKTAPSAPTPTAAVATPAPKPAVPAMPSPAPASPVAAKSADPMYGEGQRVAINSAAGVTLSQDAAGRIPGPAAKPGSPMTIVDGDLQAAGWVYHVRTENGGLGWVPERLVKLVP
ncbi:MAG: hypothetical protein U0172_04840 [Nitrospiraceae bacterium]